MNSVKKMNSSLGYVLRVFIGDTKKAAVGSFFHLCVAYASTAPQKR